MLPYLVEAAYLMERKQPSWLCLSYQAAISGGLRIYFCIHYVQKKFCHASFFCFGSMLDFQDMPSLRLSLEMHRRCPSRMDKKTVLLDTSLLCSRWNLGGDLRKWTRSMSDMSISAHR